MSKSTTGKNGMVLFLLMLAGIVLGGFVGELAKGAAPFRWLNYGQSFGFAEPIVLNLGILAVTFGLTIKITIAGLLGMLISIFLYKYVL